MKKLMTVAVFILFITGVFGCTQQKSEDTSVPGAASVMSSAESSEEIIEISVPQPSDEEISLPDGVIEDKNGYLKYTSSTGAVSAVFPEDFSVLCTEYNPADGIYLQNSDGTATLQIEAVKNEGIDRESFVGYLKEKYPKAEVFVNDSKNIICKSSITDSSGNKSLCYMRAIITDKGYNEAILYFKESETKKYDSVFNKITVA